MAFDGEARCTIALGWDCEMIGDYHEGEIPVKTHGRLDEKVIEYTRRIASVAAEAGVPMQFYILGMSLEEDVALWHDLIAQGHAVDQHTYDHFRLNHQDTANVIEQVRITSELFKEKLGFYPAGLRGPGGYRNGLDDCPEIYPHLLETGIEFVSSQYATSGPSSRYDLAADKNAYMGIKHMQPRRYASGLLEIPITGYSDRHFFDTMGRDLNGWIEHLQRCIDFAYDIGGLLYSPALHPDTHARHDPGIETIEAILAYAARKHEPVRFCTHRDIAAQVMAS